MLKTIDALRTQLANAQATYDRECERIDRGLHALVRTDPANLEDAKQLQGQYVAPGPLPMDLQAAEQPDEPAELAAPKASRKSKPEKNQDTK